ncbi:MAG: hypothetical protein JJE21_09080 [Spirochaetaceae bacterium]|nr:hypothetical protein [Spirochaetaceae bacterium]
MKERKDIEKYPLISIIIKHPNNEASDRTGIKDAFFIKENIISMTKRAINQSMVISLPYIKLTGIVWDIGCNESLYEIIEDVMRKNPRYLLSCGGRNE